MSSTSTSNLSKEFFEFVRAIGESKSKQVRYSPIKVLQGFPMIFVCAWWRTGGGQNHYSRGGAPQEENGRLQTNGTGEWLWEGQRCCMAHCQVQQKKLKEFLIRLIYVEMLGHDASFGYIKAVEVGFWAWRPRLHADAIPFLPFLLAASLLLPPLLHSSLPVPIS